MQKYAAFYFKQVKFINDTCNMFKKFLNSLKLDGNVYSIEDTNFEILNGSIERMKTSYTFLETISWVQEK